MKRYIDCFFRNWVFALAPVVILPLASLFVLTLTPRTVDVSATVWARPGSGRDLGYVGAATPAQALQNSFGQLVSIASFDHRVASRSPLYLHFVATHHYTKGWIVNDLSKNVKAVAKGSNIVTLTYTGKNTAMGKQIVSALLTQAPEEMVRLNQLPLSQVPYTVADSPSRSTSSTSKKKLLLEAGIVFAVGFLLGGTFIVVRTALDRSVRYSTEVPELIGMPVLGVVPFSPKLSANEEAN